MKSLIRNLNFEVIISWLVFLFFPPEFFSSRFRVYSHLFLLTDKTDEEQLESEFFPLPAFVNDARMFALSFQI